MHGGVSPYLLQLIRYSKYKKLILEILGMYCYRSAFINVCQREVAQYILSTKAFKRFITLCVIN